MDEDNIEKLKIKREVLRKKAYILAFEILIIFGAPAFLGYWAGKYLMEITGYGKWIQLLALGFTFVLSWVLFILRYKRLNADLKEVNGKIKELE